MLAALLCESGGVSGSCAETGGECSEGVESEVGKEELGSDGGCAALLTELSGAFSVGCPVVPLFTGVAVAALSPFCLCSGTPFSPVTRSAIALPFSAKCTTYSNSSPGCSEAAASLHTS